MQKEEVVKYLANVYVVVLADGVVERVEERVFEEVSRELRAGYFERKQAIELAQREGLQTDQALRLSERVKNLEDMLFVAYCDQVLHPEEKKPIVEYANQLGISQQQLNTIRQEAKQRAEAF